MGSASAAESAPREIFGERCAGHVLHGEKRDHAPRLKRAGERGVVVPVQIEYSAHVRMGDRARELNLALEARESGLVLDTHGLQRHPIPQVEILGFVDLAHAAGSDRPHDAISPCQHGPGFQAARQHGRPDPLAAGHIDIQQTARAITVAQHRQRLFAQPGIVLEARPEECLAIGGGLLQRLAEPLLDAGPLLRRHSNLRISLT